MTDPTASTVLETFPAAFGRATRPDEIVEGAFCPYCGVFEVADDLMGHMLAEHSPFRRDTDRCHLRLVT